MSANKNPDAPGSDPNSSSDGKPARGRRKPEAVPGEVSRALKTVYDDTLREEVPDDFLDLLGKLS